MRAGDPKKTGFRRYLRDVQTEAERRLRVRLRDRRGFKFTRQDSIGPYAADFARREERLIVEADGSQHADRESDRIRDVWLSERGYRGLRFRNREIMNDTMGVLDTILATLPPSPRLRGEGRDDLVVGATSPQGEGGGAMPDEAPPEAPPHPRSARFVPGKGDEALSPPAGRGEAHP